MKKITEWSNALNEAEALEIQLFNSNWKEYFESKIKSMGFKDVDSISEYQKAQVFNEIATDWKKNVKPTVETITEKLLTEEDIKSDADFMEYAKGVLKKAFSKDYDDDLAEKTINGILKKADGDYGAAIGILTSGLGK